MYYGRLEGVGFRGRSPYRMSEAYKERNEIHEAPKNDKKRRKKDKIEGGGLEMSAILITQKKNINRKKYNIEIGNDCLGLW